MKSTLSLIAWILVVIGALNWGLVGTFDFNLVTAIFGTTTIATKVIYILVGVAAIISIVEKSKK